MTVGSMTVDRDWRNIVRGLLYVSMAVFLVTIAIGIVNGADAYAFSHDQILTHVHSGTLGWITLSIVAGTAWLARGIDGRLAIALAALVPIYVVAFLAGIPALRVTAGAVLLVAILWLVVWVWQFATADRSLPALAVALGLTTFTYGAIIGVLRQIQLAGGPSLFPSTADVVGAHASAMVFSYLVLAAMGLIEWHVLGRSPRTTGGLAQVIALFAAGLVISGTLLFLPVEAQQVTAGFYILLELVAIVIFAVRLLPTALRVDWLGASPGRHIATAGVFVVIATIIFLYVIYKFVTDPSLTSNPDPVLGILTASDHAAFIGVITNLVFAIALRLTADRAGRWPWADQLFYWVMNAGLVVFLVGLTIGSAELKRIGAPTMGVGLLLGLATIAMRLRDSALSAAEEW